jgi:hypothetical protein
MGPNMFANQFNPRMNNMGYGNMGNFNIGYPGNMMGMGVNPMMNQAMMSNPMLTMPMAPNPQINNFRQNTLPTVNNNGLMAGARGPNMFPTQGLNQD